MFAPNKNSLPAAIPLAYYDTSEVTDKPLKENYPSLESIHDNIPSQQVTVSLSPIPSISKGEQNVTVSSSNENEVKQITSDNLTSQGNTTPPLLATTSSGASLCEIRPYPKAPVVQEVKKGRKKSKSSVYTDTPEYENRQRIEEERKRKRSLKENKSSLKSAKRSLVKTNKKRNDSSSSESSVCMSSGDSSGEEDFWENLIARNKEDK
ncbi:uncharacterized protein DDB_G0280579-like, partial [Sitophilus oryzae]|uniref:Uncharacterized protein DDB_G0280579-like n=1 Tax=Sitophilus oryzae TaxID=7048 RepID=A0A6J2YD64_SITOR